MIIKPVESHEASNSGIETKDSRVDDGWRRKGIFLANAIVLLAVVWGLAETIVYVSNGKYAQAVACAAISLVVSAPLVSHYFIDDSQ